jgi:LuxR family maltose regulon positive regulatory protein
VTDFNHRSIVNLAKTRPPRSSIELIQRQCLTLLQEAPSGGGNYLVSAPAGFGKTSLLVQYFNQLRSEDKNIAWLSFSEDDSDPMHFLSGISYSLQSLGKNVGIASHALISSGMVLSYRVILTSLMNEILSFGEPITLFLDDLHRAGSSEVEDIMLELLGSGPDNLRVIIASRSSTPKFSKLRARKNLIEVTVDDLRVSYTEAALILSKECLPKLSKANIGSLLERVDGWINGLQIAALSLNKDSNIDEYINKFSGNETGFSEYIEYDIFRKLPKSVKNFLVETSVLELLTPSLCDAITQRNDSNIMLAHLRQMNLFIVTLDEQLSCFRYHHIFRSFLQSKMLSRDKANLDQVHRRAYQWCLSNNLVHEAVNHMLAVGDWDYAAKTVDDSIEILLSRNRLATLEKWITSLPSQYASESASFQLALAWTAILQRNFHTAIQHHCNAEKLFAADQVKDKYDEFQFGKLLSNIEAQKGVITIVSDNELEIVQFANTKDVKISMDHIFFRNTYIAALVYAFMRQGKFDEGHRLGVDNEIAGSIDNFRATVYVLIFRGIGYHLAGQLKEANELYEKAQVIAGQGFKDQWMPFPVPSALAAELHFEWGNFPRAAECIQNSTAVRQESSVIEPLISYYIVSAKLALHSGSVEKALQLLAEGEAIGKQDQYPRMIAAMLCERIKILSYQGKLEAAAAAAVNLKQLGNTCNTKDSASQNHWSERQYYIDTGIATYLLSTSKPSDALAILNRHSSLARKNGQHFHLVKLLLLEASALNQQGKERSVINRLTEALQLGEQGHFLQTFVDADPALNDAFQKTLARWPNEDNSGKTGAGESYLAALIEKFDVSNRAGTQEISTDIVDIEPLTPRELDLLKLLAKGLKNKELALEMGVSQHTIAWHLKNLYSKLHVDNRTAAVTVARHFQI